MNQFGKFLGILGLVSFVYLITELLRLYSLRNEDKPHNGPLDGLITGIATILMFLNPYALIFWFIKQQDYKRISKLEKEDYIREKLPVEQKLAFLEGFREGFEYCAKFCVIEGTERKPEYSSSVKEEALHRAKKSYLQKGYIISSFEDYEY